MRTRWSALPTLLTSIAMIMFLVALAQDISAGDRSVAMTVVRINGNQLTVRDGGGKISAYKVSARLQSALTKFKAGDTVWIQTEGSTVVKLEANPTQIGEAAAQAEREKGKTQNLKPGTDAKQTRPNLSSGPTIAGTTSAMASDPARRADKKKPEVEDFTQKVGNPLATGSQNPQISSSSKLIEGVRDQSKPQPDATESRLPGKKMDFERSYHGADPSLSNSIEAGVEIRKTEKKSTVQKAKEFVRQVLGKAWAAVGPEKDEPQGISGVIGIRGLCPPESDICGVTGKTWNQLTAEAHKAICEAARKEADKVKGGKNTGGGGISDCEGSLREPDWNKVLGVKLDPLILTTEDQGRKGASKPEVLVTAPKAPKVDLRGTLPDPGGPEAGTAPRPPQPEPH
jgi:hypothetical protein